MWIELPSSVEGQGPTMSTLVEVGQILEGAQEEAPLSLAEINRRMEAKRTRHGTIRACVDFLEQLGFVTTGSKGVQWTYQPRPLEGKSESSRILLKSGERRLSALGSSGQLEGGQPPGSFGRNWPTLPRRTPMDAGVLAAPASRVRPRRDEVLAFRRGSGRPKVDYEPLYERFNDFPRAFAEMAELLMWDEPYSQVFDGSNPPFFKWFTGGKLNASANCIDRHLDDKNDKAAIMWEGEPGDAQSISYQDLHDRVNEFASVLISLGVEEDDVVTIHLPMVPALPVSMLACARIGALHNVVFAGLSGKVVARSMDDADSRVLVTIDGYYRNGRFTDHKRKADDAVEQARVDIEHVLVWTRHSGDHERMELAPDRDKLVPELLAEHQGERVTPTSRDSNDPLFLLYTGSADGQRVGIQHSTGGYLSHVAWTAQVVEGIQPDDVCWCMADIGGITGHSYAVYGPLALGATTVIYEGAPGYPDRGRIWEIAEKYDVKVLHTNPTSVRLFMKWGDEWPQKFNLNLGSLILSDEPVQPEVWEWVRDVGEWDAEISNGWLQTETGAHLIAHRHMMMSTLAGSIFRPLPGIKTETVTENGEPAMRGRGIVGDLLITRPWPGMLQTLYGKDDKFIETYWAKFSDVTSDNYADWRFQTGDGALESESGFYHILGRFDDVLLVAGHRLSALEVEKAILGVGAVDDVVVVPRRDPLKGEVPVVFASLQGDVEATDDLKGQIIRTVESEIGPMARPASIYFVDDLPRTSSGEIMRKLLVNIANGEEIGHAPKRRDTSVLQRMGQEFE